MTAPPLPVTLIAAVARNRVIGRDGRMPWKLPGDLAHFRAATLGKPVLMGRRTFEAIGEPLVGRDTLVLSRDPGFSPPGVTVARSLDAALDASADLGRARGATEIMVAGGGTLYAALIPSAHRLVITWVDLSPEGDTTFPDLGPGWQETARITPAPHPGDTARYSVVTYQRA